MRSTIGSRLSVLATVVVFVFSAISCEPERPLVEPDTSEETGETADGAQGEIVLTGTDLSNFQLEDGTYQGVGDGYHGDIEVEVTVNGGEVVAIDVLSQSERDDLWEDAWDSIPDVIIETQTTDVDSVTGATFTSEGIVDAVASALREAL